MTKIMWTGLAMMIVVLLPAAMTAFPQEPFTDPEPGKLFDPQQNVIRHYGNSEALFLPSFCRMDTLALNGRGIINVVHIGDSHIQAGFLTEVVRTGLSTGISGGTGGRGLVFPYRMAKSNGPPDYAVTFTGGWEYCRNAERQKDCVLGLTGFFVRTKDSLTEITLRFRDGYRERDFSMVRILTDSCSLSYNVELTGSFGSCRGTWEQSPGSLVFRPDGYPDSLCIRIRRTDTLSGYFTLYGIRLENGDDGIVYHSLGVNGAAVPSFLKCSRLKEELSSLHPDLIIISLGTNDASMAKFDADQFENEYAALIRVIRSAKPGVPVLLTVPGDFYRKRRYDDKHLPEVRNRIIRLAQRENCAVWDLYGLMGGAKSIQKWYTAGLVARDKVHLKPRGYQLQGELLFNAFMRLYLSRR